MHTTPLACRHRARHIQKEGGVLQPAGQALSEGKPRLQSVPLVTRTRDRFSFIPLDLLDNAYTKWLPFNVVLIVYVPVR
jgi:hypothetical protein